MVTKLYQRQPLPDRPAEWPRRLLQIARIDVVVVVALALASCNRGPREVRLDVVIASGMFERHEIYVPADTRVAITLRNRDDGPNKLAHNFVLVQPGAVLDPRPVDILMQTPLIDPGKNSTFRFFAPSIGNYEFLCTGPGHKPAQDGQPSTVMRGKFVVQ